jgi:GntR family transcriptional repressor for pyruvate dehydrogenase complex
MIKPMLTQYAKFSPIQTKRTFEEVSNRIKEMIFEGVFKPDKKLPSEKQLADLFQVGRQSVREALRLLELSGFITIQRGIKGGPVIKNTMLNRITSIYLDAFKFDRISIQDVTLARFEIEKSILQLVFENIDQSDLEALEANVQKANQKLKDNVIAFEENVDFHRLLAKASKNHVFIIVMESLLSVLSNFRSKADTAGFKYSKAITQLHGNMLDAIRKGRRKRAFVLLEANLKQVENIISEDLALGKDTIR